MGPPRPGPLLNRPRGDKCSEQGRPSQANRGPKNLGSSCLFTEALEAKKDDKETIKTAIRDAVSIASQVCNYRHPKLATVKVGGDRSPPARANRCQGRANDHWWSEGCIASCVRRAL
jgi:hypothetical protein